MEHVTMKPALVSSPAPQIVDMELWERAVYNITGKYDYFETKWRPRLAGAAADVIHALWKITRFDKRAWRKVEDIVPRYAAISEAAHVSRATVARVLQRDQAGQFTYSYYGRMVGPDLHRWILALNNRWRVNQETHAVWQTSNHYQVAAIIPPVPEDDELVRAEYARLVVEREQRTAEAVASGMKKFETHVAVSNLDPCSSLNMSQQITHPTDTLADRTFDHAKVKAEAGGEAIRRATPGTPKQVTNRGEKADQQAPPGKDAPQSHHINSSADLAAPRAARPVSEADREERDHTAWVLADKFSQAGSQVPQNAANCLMKEMEEAQVPYAIMLRLVRHAFRKSNADGRNVGNRAGHYMTTARNLIAEVRKRKWNLDAIIEADEVRWTKARQHGPGALTATERAERLRNGGPSYGYGH